MGATGIVTDVDIERGQADDDLAPRTQNCETSPASRRWPLSLDLSLTAGPDNPIGSTPCAGPSLRPYPAAARGGRCWPWSTRRPVLQQGRWRPWINAPDRSRGGRYGRRVLVPAKPA